MSLKRFAALLLSVVLTMSLLAGCGGSSSGDASSETVPDSKVEASASGLLPSDDDNSILDLTDPAAAFECCLGWGAGTAGTSLKAAVGADAMLKWAEQNKFATQNQTTVKKLLQKWFDSLTDVQQEGFSEAWPMIKADADTMLTDKESISGVIESAGLDIDTLPGCSQKNWDAFVKVMDSIVPDAPAQ